MSNIIRFTPFQEFDRFLDDDFFMPVWGKRGIAPAIDLYETENEVVAEVGIPGFDPKKVNIEIENNVLHIRGEEQQEVEDKDRGYYRKEVRRGAFARSVSLPTEVESGKVNATCEKGLLKIVMPKSEKVKPRKVNVEIKD